MAKGSFLDDTFEKALEAGHSMAKSGGKQIKQTFNPFDMVKNSFSSSAETPQSPENPKSTQSPESSKNKATPLDFAKLQESYAKQDDQKAKVLANRLFQLVKQGEEKVKTDKEREEQEKKRNEIWKEKEKKQQAEQQKYQEQSSSLPHGKEHKSILGGKKKKATPDTAELRPSKGKQ